MTARCALPQRRFHEVFEFEHWGTSYKVGLGRFLDGRLGEVFINTNKVGTAADVLARDSAVLISLALQHGIAVSAMRHALTREINGEASGPIGKLLDLIDAEESTLEQAVGGMG